MSSVMPQPQMTPIVACTVSRDVQNFDLLIEDMEDVLGESWEIPLTVVGVILVLIAHIRNLTNHQHSE